MRRRGAVLALLLLCACRPALPAEQPTVRLQSIVDPGVYCEVPLRELRLVNPHVKQSNRGRLIAAIALRAGRHGYASRRYFYRPRIACAAFVSWVLRQTGWRWTSNSAQGLYNLLRRHRGKLVADHVSTRYVAYYSFYRGGDVLCFWKGRRIGHVEVFVGGGSTVGTSSSTLHIGVRRIANRGFKTMSVVRL